MARADSYRSLSFWHDTVPGTLAPGEPLPGDTERLGYSDCFRPASDPNLRGMLKKVRRGDRPRLRVPYLSGMKIWVCWFCEGSAGGMPCLVIVLSTWVFGLTRQRS